MRRSPPHIRSAGRVSGGSQMTCLGPGRKGIGITFGRRDARGLTFSVVIQTRVMQPGEVKGGKHNWRIALCGCGMTLALHHRVHSDETLAPPLCAQARGIPGRTLLEGEGRIGYRASPQLQSRPLFRRRWLSAVPVPVLLGSLSPVTGWCCSRRSTAGWRRTTHSPGASIRGCPLKRRSISWARAIMSSAMAMPKAEANTL